MQKLLQLYNARIMYYDTLVEQSLATYSDNLDKYTEAGEIRAIIDSL